MATRVDLQDLSFSATMLMTIPQSTSLTCQARMSTNPTPVRIPKLKVRNRVDEITPAAAQEQDASPGSLTSAPSTTASPDAPSTPRSEYQPQIFAPAPQRPNQNASIFGFNDAQPKKKGIMSFLSVKEPSTAAFLKYAEQQQRAAALKGSASGPMQTVSRQKLPDYVPKVNKKWDGMPKAAHQPGNEQWKSSMDQGSFLGKIGKRSSSSAAPPSASSRASKGASASTRSSSSRSRGSSGSGSHGSSGRTSRERLESARADAFALSRSPSHIQDTSTGQESPNFSPAHNLDLDGYRTRTNTKSSNAPSTPFVEFADYSNFLPPAAPPNQEVRKNSSTETLKAPIEPVPSAASSTSLPETNPASGSATADQTSKDFNDVHPALRPKPQEIVDDDLAPPTPIEATNFTPQTPDDVFPGSPHTQPDYPLLDPIAQSAPFSSLQWPLPAPTVDESTSDDDSDAAMPPPPIPIRSPIHHPEITERRLSHSSPAIPQFSTSPMLPQSPSSPPQSPSRAGSASPRSFSRPFSLGPITPPSPQEQFASPSQTPAPPPGSIAGPAIKPSHFRGHAFNTGAGLRAPASAIGRVVTKDSKLTPIIEADTASVLSVPLSMHLEDDEDTNRESAVLGAHTVEGTHEHLLTHLHSGDSSDENSSDDGTATELDPSDVRSPTPNDPSRAPSFDDNASIHSQLSGSWYRSPKERLGLGGLIRHDKTGVPWPLEQEEDLDYVAGSGASSAEIERSAAAVAERRRKSFFMGFGGKR